MERNVPQIDRVTETETLAATAASPKITNPQNQPALIQRAQPVDISPVKILNDACGLSAFPGDKLEWVEVVYSMAEKFGVEATTQAMRQASSRWVQTRNKSNNLPYRITNLNWINWANESLLGNDTQAPIKHWRDMTPDELVEYQKNGGTFDDKP